MKNNNQYILLLLCVLLIFILIQKNREYFENQTKEQEELEKKRLEEIEKLKNQFDKDKEVLIKFIQDKNKEIIEDESSEKKQIREELTNYDYYDIINNNLLEKYKQNLEIKNNNVEIYLAHKLYEEGNEINLKIHNILLVIELDSNNKEHRIISVKKYSEEFNHIIPYFKLVPNGDKFKIMEKKFDDKIGSMPDPNECVIS